MMLENGTAMTIGVAIAAGLVGMGVLLGQRLAVRRRGGLSPAEPVSEADRERMLQLLQDLGSWTSEYSGNVTDYQNKLGELTHAVRSSDGPSQSEARVMVLLQQIMQSNDQLKTRLDAAERQLEKQTQQIECYLTEARTDGLTGLYNRRAFDQRLDEMFKAYRGGGRSFVVALVDVDKFKSINDSHGHQAGDQVLQQLARTLRGLLSNATIVARFGGEEFAVIMDGPLRIAAEKLNEVRKAVARERMDAGNSQLELTISVGLSEPRDEIVVGPLVRRADEALYAAKNIGRNRVYYHDGRGPALVGAPEVAS